MAGELEGKVAIVTGGGWNVGLAVARRFAREGARVALAGRTTKRLEEALRLIRADGGEAIDVVCDVTVLADVEALVERTVAAFGTVDVLAAIAGGGGGYEEVDAIDPAWWEHVVRLNLVGSFHCVRAVLPILRGKGSGSILLCTGGGASFPETALPCTAYAASKAGICRLTDQLAVELHASGIRVNCIQPELTWDPDKLAAIEAEERATGRPHPGREHNHSPGEAAELALWLVSDASAPLTARTVSVNDTWWRDPGEVAAVCGSLHAYTLRRVGADGCVPR